MRTLKYTRYLADCGWRVTMLCPNQTAYEVIDDEMLSQVPDNVRIVRTGYLNSKRHFGVFGHYPALFALPDVWVGWLPWAIGAGERLGREDPVDLIYSTSPPATAHVVAWRLARRLKRPWVVDFRDPWIEEPPELGAPNGVLYRRIDKWLERQVVAASTHIVTTTDALRETLATRYPNVAPERFTVIPNGYDEADFSNLSAAGSTKSGHFLMMHAGSINPHFRDPVPLINAIRSAADGGHIDPKHVCLRFLGGGAYGDSDRIKAAIASARLTGSVEFVPRLPYSETLGQLATADVLLLLQASEDTRGLVPAKVYEYLRLQKPMLALVLGGETTRLLEKTGGGVAVDPADHSHLASEITRFYRAWQDRATNREPADLAVVRRYDRRALTRDLAATFDAIVSRSPLVPARLPTSSG